MLILAETVKWLRINGSASVHMFTNKKYEVEFVVCKCLTVGLNLAGTAVVS